MDSIKWYVLQVATGKELEILKQLLRRGVTAVVPIEKRNIRKGGSWSLQDYTVFPGYVFIRIRYNWSKYYIMSGISGIIKILGGGRNPSALEDEEAERIVMMSEIMKEPSVLSFDENRKFTVVSGILTELEQYITKVKRRYKRVELEVPLAGEKKKITLSFVEQTSDKITD